MALLALFPLLMITVLIAVATLFIGEQNLKNISPELRATYEEIEMPLAA